MIVPTVLALIIVLDKAVAVKSPLLLRLCQTGGILLLVSCAGVGRPVAFISLSTSLFSFLEALAMSLPDVASPVES